MIDRVFHPRAARWLLLALLLLPLHRSARADDGIFDPAPAAKSAIAFDGRGFLIHGKRTFLVSGSLHYARVPRALWRDRLLRMKRAGFNTVETYVFWNVHEPREGQWNFSGDADFGAFLDTAKSLGMYAIVRTGPYVCAEWDSGGYPVWLRFKPGLRVREDNAPFVAAVDKFFDKVIPMIASRQIHRGGNVVLVQLENEHPQGWGKEMPNAYFRHLRDKALALGIKVPHFFSGLHHGSDPAGNNPWDSAGRTNPWFTTEFWPGWFDLYGPLSPENLRRFDRGTWKILAYGGNGYNYYMLHGGTNFASFNNQEDASSYDYGAAIGQAGDLRPIYYRFKRAAWFARSFESVLENSENATASFADAATTPGVRVTARRSPEDGTLLFLDNNGREAVKTQVKFGDALYPSAGPMTLAAGEIAPVVRDFKILPNVTLERAARVLGVFPQGKDWITLVVHGPSGDPAEVRLRVAGEAQSQIIVTRFNPTAPESTLVRAGEKTIRVVFVNTELADRTWSVGDDVLCGPEYVGETEKGKRTIERPWQASGSAGAYVFSADERVTTLPAERPLDRPVAPKLGRWTMRSASDAALPNFDDRGWFNAAGGAPPMGADGDTSAVAWYRSTVSVPKSGDYSLQMAGVGDRALVYANGRRIDVGSNKAFTLPLQTGVNALAVFTAHDGRDKLFNYLGPLDTRDVKGIRGPVTLLAGQIARSEVTKWRWKSEPGGANAAAGAPPAASADGWQTATADQDVFGRRRGFAWFQTELPALPDAPAGSAYRIAFTSVDDNGIVFLNGKRLLRHEGWNQPFTVPLDSAWNAGGPNVLTVLVENTDNTGGISGAVTLQSIPPGAEIPVTNWRLRGGVGDPEQIRDWHPMGKPIGPSFYRATFSMKTPAETGPRPILRLTTTGLTHGYVYLNGHNLGRYPEKIPVDGVYLPECWIKNGENALVILDEEGASPLAVTLKIEEAASRFVY